ESGLPPVRLHDLRHGAASLAHCAGVDLKTVQAQLGHSSIVLTADTYTSVLTDLLAYAAEATARLVLAVAARNPGRRHRRNDLPRKSAAPVEIATVERPVSRPSGRTKGGKRGRPHTSHRRPTKIKGV
ncbi:MAG TPA: tyrosine-type recombinase/integrase, partial [Kutzneria sp.]